MTQNKMALRERARTQESLIMEKKFYSHLYQSRRKRTKFSKNSVYLTDEIYKKTIRDVLYSKSIKTKKPRDWWLLARYDVILENGEHKIILPETESKPLYYVRDSEIFGILERCHNSVGHAGRDRMIKMLSDKYKNVIRQHVEIFLQVCDFCQKRQKKPRNLIVYPSTPPHQSSSARLATQEAHLLIDENEFNSRCQFDIIDLHSWPTDDYRYVLVYQDFTTKFITLRALRYAKAEDVSKELLNIFFLMGAPYILQSGHGIDFTRRTIMHLRNSWDNFKISVGENVAKLEDTQDIENLIRIWMRNNQSKEWTKCIGNIQMTKNTSCFDSKISPFQKVFKRKMRFGLSKEKTNDETDLEEEDSLTVTCKVCLKTTSPAEICDPCLTSKLATSVQTRRDEVTPQKRPVIYCTSYGCTSNSKEIVFFSFPKNRNRCIEWLKAICRDDLLSKDADYINEKHKICAKHFKPNMFPHGETNILLPSAYPQLSLECEEFTHSIFGSSFQPEISPNKAIKKHDIDNDHINPIPNIPAIIIEEIEETSPMIKEELRGTKRKVSIVSSDDADSDECDSIFGDFDYDSDTVDILEIEVDKNLDDEIYDLKEHANNLSKTYNLFKKLISLELRRNNRNFNDSEIQSVLTTCKNNKKLKKNNVSNDICSVVIKSEPVEANEMTMASQCEILSAVEAVLENGNITIKEEPATDYVDVATVISKEIGEATVIIKEEINV